MILLDSSVWIQLWLEPSRQQEIERVAEGALGEDDQVLVPATVVHETWRWLLKNVRDEGKRSTAGSVVTRQISIPITAERARRAAALSVETRLAAADATILACAREFGATLLTFDTDFSDIPDAVVLAR